MGSFGFWDKPRMTEDWSGEVGELLLHLFGIEVAAIDDGLVLVFCGEKIGEFSVLGKGG